MHRQGVVGTLTVGPLLGHVGGKGVAARVLGGEGC
jgi:hypothetical protein